MEQNITSAEDRLAMYVNISASDKSELTERQNELVNLAMKLDHGTPYFKIKHFVGDSQITAFAKYKQFLLELRGREEVIEHTLVQIARQEMDIEILKEELEVAATPAQIKRKEFELVTNQNDLLKMHRRLRTAYRERDDYVKAIEEMYASGEAFMPDGTDLKDVVLDPEKSEQMEAQHWVYRLGKQAALDMISFGKIGTGNMDAISQLDTEDQVEAFKIALSWTHRVNGAMREIETEVTKELLSNEKYSIELGEERIPRMALGMFNRDKKELE